MQKRLYRSRKEKKLGGVCGGIAEYFEVDPVWVRIAFVLITVMHGVGIIVYLACLVLIPLEPWIYTQAQPASSAPAEDGTGTTTEQQQQAPAAVPFDSLSKKDNLGGKGIFGAILVIVGSLLLFQNLIPSFDFEEVFPVILIILGVWLLINPTKKGQNNEL